ncbi:MAG: TIGR01440 family protein [Symbiobacteriaceae bacterium]|nr:TIGR01440 family protein [Symbiobacteriaceae bacterium]
MDLERFGAEAEAVLDEIIQRAGLIGDSLLVIGCSTSEVQGKHIGSASSMEVAGSLFTAFARVAQAAGIVLAFQCCEHLNRALVINRSTSLKLGFEPVSVVPMPGAGGAMAATAFVRLADAIVVETLHAKAAAGLDIGDTLIGMHIHPVAVPLRLQRQTSIGEAHLTAAYSRPKLIGGARAVYEMSK